MHTRIMYVFLACALTIGLNAQTTKKKKDKKSVKTEQKDDVVAVDQIAEVSIDEVRETTTSSGNSIPKSFEPISSIRYNSKYETYTSINDQYDFFCEKFSSNKTSALGIADKNGTVILPNIFSKSYSNTGRNEVILYINNNYGVYNVSDRTWEVPMEYERLEYLGNNLFRAKKNGNWGVIDNNNAILVPFEWKQISNVSGLDNYIIVTDNSYPSNLMGVFSLVDKKLTIPCIYTSLSKLNNYNYFQVSTGSKENIIDINNAPLFKKWYDDITIPSKSRNYYIVKLENRYGVIDDKETPIIPIEYIEFGSYPYSDGSYLARNKDGKYGFIKIDGKITLPFEYDNLIKKYYDNVVSVRNGKCGLVQVNSGVPSEIVTCDYDNIKGNSKTFIVEKAGKFGLLDNYGKLITAVEFQSLEPLGDNSDDGAIFKARKDGIIQLIDEQGKSIGNDSYVNISIVPKKDNSYYTNTRFNYLMAQLKNGKFSIVDKVGKTISKPIFDNIITENENIFIVISNKKYGLYSLLDQKFIADCQYDLIIKTSDNYIGFSGKKIDFLTIKSGEVIKLTTIK